MDDKITITVSKKDLRNLLLDSWQNLENGNELPDYTKRIQAAIAEAEKDANGRRGR